MYGVCVGGGVQVCVDRFDVLECFALTTAKDMREQHDSYHLSLHMHHKYEHDHFVHLTQRHWVRAPQPSISIYYSITSNIYDSKWT